MSDSVEIGFVSSESPLFGPIMELGGQNRRWLGFFPEGAFCEYAENHGMIAASKNRELAASFRRLSKRESNGFPFPIPR